MKVLVLVQSLSRRAGGLFFSVRNLSNEIYKSGAVSIEVAGMEDDDYAVDSVFWKDLKVVSFKPARFLKKFGFSRDLLRHVFVSDADLIHLHGIWNFTSFTLFLRSRFVKTNYIVSPRGMLDKWILKKGRFKKLVYWWLFERWLLSGAKCIHALNESEKQSILRLLPSAKVVITPNGVDKINRPSADVGSELKTIVFIGRLDAKKGVVELVRAWRALPSKHCWKLEIYGWGDQAYIDQIKNEVDLCGDRSVVLGGSLYNADKDRVLSSVHAFVLPSYSEGLPMAVLEAWSYGLPVLMTDECNLTEAFQHGVAKKITLDKNLPDQLYEFMQLSDEEIKKMSVLALDYVQRNYMWSDISRQMTSVYKACLN